MAKNNQLTTLLERFYHNPVAVVSFELFLSIVVILFFAAFAIRPTLLTMSDLIKEIEDKRKLATQLTQKSAALAAAQSNFAGLEERVTVVDEALPRGVDLVYALKVLEKIASDQNLTIINMTVLAIPPDPPADAPIVDLERQSMAIQIVVTGSYESIRDFAEELQQSRRSFVIERITFSTEDARGQKTLEATLLIGVPYFGIKEEQ